MKIERGRRAYIFDTSSLLDLVGTSLVAKNLRAAVDLSGQFFYHPISLSEIADYVHKDVWLSRRPKVACEPHIKVRRALITLLYHQRISDDPKYYLAGCRFLPFVTSFDYYSSLAHCRQQPAAIRFDFDKRVVVYASITDHQILHIVYRLSRSRFDAVYVSGDKFALGAAARLGVRWLYSKDPSVTVAFPW